MRKSLWVFASVPRADFQIMDRLLKPIAESYGIKGTGAGCCLSDGEFWERDNSFDITHLNEIETAKFKSECKKILNNSNVPYIKSKVFIDP